MQTKQEFFDKTLRLMIAQGEPAAMGASCVYRMQKGDKIIGCAIGAHFPKDVPEVVAGEIGPVTHLICTCRTFNVDLSALLDFDVNVNENRQFLGKLQEAHDLIPAVTIDWVGDFKDRMRDLAKEEGLIFQD